MVHHHHGHRGQSRLLNLSPQNGDSLLAESLSRQAFVVEPDTVEISIGGSSADDKLKTKVTVQ